jgi:hypothetical protein
LVVGLKDVWEVCELEGDIKYGRLELARFAVELFDVLDGKADKFYINLCLSYLTSMRTRP